MMNQTEIYRVNDLPVFQNLIYPDVESAINCVRGDLVLVQNKETGLVFNQAFEPDLVHYNSEYQNEQGLSSFFQEHLRTVETIVSRHLKGCSLIEVGCGKGGFLSQLHNSGFDIIGMDPAYEGDSPLVRKEYFTSGLGVHGDGIILRHVLEHISDPMSFLQRIKEANGGTGKVYIEVPCLEWIRDNHAWFDMFYEHVNYFRLNDLKRMFSTICEAGHVFGRQYLYIVAELNSLTDLKKTNAEPFRLPSSFLEGIKKQAVDLRKSNSEIIVWGGASKGVIFSLLMQREGLDIDFVVDINPAKQEMFLPVTGLEVYSPEKALSLAGDEADVLVMNGNYLDEVKELTDNKFNYRTVDHG